MSTKVCTKCKEEKELIEFGRDCQIKSGVRSRCKKCVTEYSREYVKNNYDKHKESQRNYYINNSEKRKENSRNWRSNNQERMKERYKKWQKNNKEKCRELNAKHRKKYPKRYRELSIKKKYNLSIEEYEAMVLSQDNKCKVCNKESKDIDKRTGKIRVLAIDHNHKTGKVRGLLCSHCNTMLGLSKDSIETLKNAIKYLEGDNEE